MKDPKDWEVRRAVGWVDFWFVEIVLTPTVPKKKGERFHVSILANGDCHYDTPARDLLEAQLIFDAVEQRLRNPSQPLLDSRVSHIIGDFKGVSA